MTRVTLVSYDDDPPMGGQGVYLHGVREALRRHGTRVHTISGRGEHAIAFAHRTWRAPLDFSLQVNRYPRILVRASPDVVHVSGGPGGVLLWRPLEVPVVYTAHHTYRQAHRRGARRMLGSLEARCYRRAAMVLAVSPSTADAVLAMGIPAASIEVVSPGVAVVDAAESEREPGAMLFVGRLEPEKGILDAIDVMAVSGARGVVIGSGSLAGDVRRRAASSAGTIQFLGSVDAATLQREYRRASLLLMPSRFEGLGLVALEAQAAGTPVVGYDVDGLRDAVRDGGVLVRAGDRDALIAACAALLGDEPRRRELGARGRDMVRREHSWDTVAARLTQIYAGV